ncbi:MAG: cohesin domain-containing protein [Euryarchaeota archaeon]|nr:cohesin domain-containing protein [Euryarchaeota archaeon]
MHAKNQERKLAAILILLTVFATHAAATTVSIDAHEYITGNKFDVIIEIDDVEDLASGQFDLSFNSSVVNAIDLDDIDEMIGEIGGDDVPVEACYFMDTNSIRLLFKPGVSGAVSGDGSLATIKFEVVGEDGDSSFLNLSDGVLVDKDQEYGESNIIPAEWVSGMVTIGDPPSRSIDPPNGSSGTDTVETHTVIAYVKNIDDDKLDVHLLIDGNDEGFESISSGKTKEYDDYYLDEGAHTFMIRWFDTDTDKWYEKTEEHTITDVTTIILLTDEHDEDDDKISAQMYVNNLDDDDLNVYLYIDGKYKKYMSVASNGSEDYGEYEFEEDEEELHSFKIKWFDPGTGEDYEKITRSYITGEEAVTLYVDKHTEEDIVVLPEETPTPIQTTSTPATTSTQRVKESSEAAPMSTPEGTTFHTNPELSEDSTEDTNSENGITPLYTLVGFIAAVFALFQIGRI